MKTRSMHAAALTGAIVLCSAGTKAHAQESTPQTGLADIVVTAQRRAENVQDVPLTITAVSNAELSRAGVTGFRDLQTVVPGLTMGGQGTSSAPAIRGVSTNISQGGTENPNAVYIDGIYQTARALLGVDFPDVERVEVLKGPQGTLFGRNATGGAIQIFTRNPSFTPSGDIKLSGSYYTGDGSSRSSPRVDASAFVTGPIVNDVLAVSLSGGYSWTQGYQTNDADGSRTGLIRKTNLRGKVLLQATDSLRIVAGGYYVKTNGSGYLLGTPYKGLSAAAAPLYTTVFGNAVVPTQPYHSAFTPGTATTPAYNIADFEGHGFFGRADLDLDFGTITSTTGYNKSKTTNWNSLSQSYSPQCVAFTACIDYHFEPNGKEFSQELVFSSDRWGAFSFTGGLFYYHGVGTTQSYIQETQQLIPNHAPGLNVEDSRASKDAYAAFGEGTYRPTDRLSLIVGLRYTKEKQDDDTFGTDTNPVPINRKRTFNAVTPRFSIKYDLTDDFNVYATVSKGFKSGLTGLTNSANGFAAVAPETIWSYEAGLKYASPTFRANASFFYYDYKDKQEQTFTGTGAIVQNTGPVRLYGADFDAELLLADRFSVRGGLSWIPVAKYRDFPDASGQSLVQDFGGGQSAGVPGGYLPGYQYNVASCAGTFNPLCVAVPDNPATPYVEGATFNATGMRLIRAPKVTGSLTLSYDATRTEKTGFDASATLFYSSRVLLDITGTIVQPAYAALNAQAGYSLDENLRVSVFGRNLTNKAYLVSGLTSSAGFSGNYSPPREIGIALGYKY